MPERARLGRGARGWPAGRGRLLFYSRSADDLVHLARSHPDLQRELCARRPVLLRIGAGRRALSEALQLEMLDMMEADERRLASYQAAASAWAGIWPGLAHEIEGLPLLEAHARLIERAEGVLPRGVRP